MGNTGSRVKKLGKSIRRMSLSKSKDHLDRTAPARRSRSLMNLSVLKKKLTPDKKSKSTITVSEPNEDEVENKEIHKNKETTVMRKFSSCILHIKKLKRRKSTIDSETQSQEGLETYEKLSNSPITNTCTPTKEIEMESEVNNPRLQNDETITNVQSSEVSSDSSYVSTFEEASDNIQDSVELDTTKTVIINKTECIGVIALKKIDEALHDLEQLMEKMSHDDLMVHLSTFKDEIHILWKMSYEVKESSEEVHPMKANTIEYAKNLLHKLYSKAFKQHDYREIE